jgi:hypothetical protein
MVQSHMSYRWTTSQQDGPQNIAEAARPAQRRPRRLVALAAAALLPLAAPALAASPIPADSRQMLLSVSPSWNDTRAIVRRYERSAAGEAWRPVGSAYASSLGGSGLGWGVGLHRHDPAFGGPTKKEGDGRSPAGVYLLREATGYAEAAPPGTRLPYRQATPSLKCVDDPRSAHYNRLVDEARVTKDWSSAEDMRRADELYRLTVWVAHNDDPPRADAGSCIFLHFREKEADVTAGCTAFDPSALEGLLTWLDPAWRPVLVQLPEPVRKRLAGDWGLPPE